MRVLQDKTAVVTGAGSGIGRETALHLAAEGMKVAVCDVHSDRLKAIEHELSAACIAAAIADVSDRAAVAAFADQVHRNVAAIDVLVNNAGVGLAGRFLDMSDADWDWIIGINLMGVVNMSRAFVPAMAERGQGGHVVNIASMAGYFAAPEMSGYCAAKFGVLGLSQCLRGELRAHHIGVSAICPGLINTNIVATSRIVGRADAEEVRGKAVDIYVKRSYGPERVAKAIIRAIRRNKAVVPVTPEAWAAYYLGRLWPAAARTAGRALIRRADPAP